MKNYIFVKKPAMQDGICKLHRNEGLLLNIPKYLAGLEHKMQVIPDILNFFGTMLEYQQ